MNDDLIKRIRKNLIELNGEKNVGRFLPILLNNESNLNLENYSDDMLKGWIRGILLMEGFDLNSIPWRSDSLRIVQNF